MMNAAPSPTAALRLPARWRSVAAGVVAAATALGTGELVAGLVPGGSSPIAAVGAAVIDLAPPGSKEVVVALFGTADKVALSALVATVVLVAGGLLGLVGRRSLLRAAIGIAMIAVVGAVAGLRSTTAIASFVVFSAALQVIVGIGVLTVLRSAARVTGAGAGTAGSGATGSGATTGVGASGDGRRGFLVRAGALGALAVVGGGVGRALLEGRASAYAAAAGTGGAGAGGGTGPAGSGIATAPFPQVVDPAPTPPPDATLSVDGITPLITTNDAFYRIDTALITPSVDLATWRLRVHGMVDREVTLSMGDLLELPLVERYVTIACVSNEVGGNLIGNALWTGVRLADVLDMAGVRPGATQVVPRSVDGWTAGFPTAWITDPAHPRDALIAVRMNGAPLPAQHGFPARLIVPGLYGYVSATKWLSELELTTLEAFDAYWVPRGWAKEAPILTQSRIDTPRNGAQAGAGPVVVAGVAWAPDRGIAKVEVRVDDGAWQAATLATAIGPQTWVQWRWTWQAPAGEHVVAVRATDGTGAVQAADVTRPDPDGARGYHAVSVSVA